MTSNFTPACLMLLAIIATAQMAAAQPYPLKQGAEPAPGTPEAFTEYMQKEIALWGNVIRAAGIKAE